MEKRRNFKPEEKAKIVLEVLREEIKYKTNKFSTERSGAVTIEHGRVISIIQYGISE